MRKKTVIPVLAAALLFLLAACGKQAGDLTGNSALREEAEAAGQESAAETAESPAEEEEAKAGAEKTEDAEDEAAEKEQPFLTQVRDDDPAIAYVLVRTSNGAGLLPLPVNGEYTRTVRQITADGTEAVNVLHLTPDGFWMEDANCEGHDCINEGEVTLENRETRVLWNMIICLPHQLSAELITREEAKQLTGQ